MSKLLIRGLRKSFDGQPVLHSIDLTVERGTLLALLGPSGSGKTTLLRVLCGFERADQGMVEIDGVRVVGEGQHMPAEQRRIGYVPQEGALFPHLSVAENIVFGLPRSERRARRRVEELLDLVGLPADYAQRAPQQLSGGQQQRVALARALAPAPNLVMLDEPFSSLDAALRVETREAVSKALVAAGATAVLVTHDQSEALSLGHEVAVLWKGRLVQTASPQTIYREPATRELAAFVGDAVLLPGVANRGVANCALGALKLMRPVADGPVDVMLRPEQIRVLAGDEIAGDRLGSVCGAFVTGVKFNGPYASVDLRTDGDTPVSLCATVPGHRAPDIGQQLTVVIDGNALAYSKS